MRFSFVLLFCLISNALLAQQADGQGKYENACNPKMIFLITEQLTEYKDGQKALVELLNDKVDFPGRVKGVIHLRFLVNCKGEASDFELIRGTHKNVGQQIVQVLEENQGFLPAKQKGKAVDSWKMMQLKYTRGKFLNSGR